MGIFFKDCVHLGSGRVKDGTGAVVNAVVDNRYTTFATGRTYVVDTRRDGVASRITHLFTKTVAVTGVTLEVTDGTGTGFTNRAIPTTVAPDEGGSVATAVDGFQHQLYELPTPISASEVTLRFEGSGTSRRVVAFMLLESDIEINANRFYSRIIPHRVDRTGRIHRDPRGALKRVRPIGASRHKWELDLTVMFIPGLSGISAKAFVRWMEDHPNFVYAREWNRYPDEVYPATFLDLDVATPYRSRWKLAGNTVDFRVGER